MSKIKSELNQTDSNSLKSKGFANYWFLIIAILTLLTFIHLFTERTINEVIKYSSMIAIPIAITILFILIFYGIKEGFTKKYICIIVCMPILVAFWSASYYALAITIKDIYKWVSLPIFTKNTTIILTIFITLIFGIILFYIRLYLRSIYGISELILGLSITGYKINDANLSELFESGFIMTYITASVYLVVRGLDNVHQGLTKAPYDPIIIKFFEFLKKIK